MHITATTAVSIESNVLIGSKVLVADHLHRVHGGRVHFHLGNFPNIRPLTSYRSVLIEENVFIDDNVCILPGMTIGSGAVIEPHSVVAYYVPKNCIVSGSPEIVIKKICRNGK